MSGNVAAVAGWCRPDAVEVCKRATHDTLIQMLGPRRRSGVSWFVLPHDEGGVDLIEKMLAETDEDGLDGADPIVEHYRTIRGYLKLHGGILVVATAEGVR